MRSNNTLISITLTPFDFKINDAMIITLLSNYLFTYIDIAFDEE